MHKPEETYKCWSEDKINTFKAVTKEGLNASHAAKEYKVPRSTLGDRVSGSTQIGANEDVDRSSGRAFRTVFD